MTDICCDFFISSHIQQILQQPYNQKMITRAKSTINKQSVTGAITIGATKATKATSPTSPTFATGATVIKDATGNDLSGGINNYKLAKPISKDQSIVKVSNPIKKQKIQSIFDSRDVLNRQEDNYIDPQNIEETHPENIPQGRQKRLQIQLQPSQVFTQPNKQKLLKVNADVARIWKITLQKNNHQYQTSCLHDQNKNISQCLLAQSQKIKSKEGIVGTLEIQKMIKKNGGYTINQNIYNSERIRAGNSSYQYFTFFPSLAATILIDCFQSTQSQFISGAYGTSKSTMLIFIIQVSKYEVLYYLSLGVQQRKQYIQQYRSIKKYFYLGLKNEATQAYICKALLDQVQQSLTSQEFKKKSLKKSLKQVLEQIQDIYNQNEITINLVIDQFNVVASILRKKQSVIDQKSEAQSEKLTQLNQSLDKLKLLTKFHEETHKNLCNKFKKIIYCSSVNIQRNYLEQIYTDQLKNSMRISLDYINFQGKSWHALEKLKWIWFQVGKNIKGDTQQSDEKLDRQYKKIYFDELTNIKNMQMLTKSQQKSLNLKNKKRLKPLKPLPIIQKIQENPTLFQWLRWTKPLDINRTVKLVRAQNKDYQHFSQYNDLETKKKHFLPFLQKIKEVLPTIIGIQYKAHINKEKGRVKIDRYDAYANLVYKTSQYINKGKQQMLKKQQFFVVQFDNRELLKHLDLEYAIIDQNRVKIYNNPLHFQAGLLKANDEFYHQVGCELLQRITNTSGGKYLQRRKLFGQYLDAIFSELIQSDHFQLQLKNIKYARQDNKNEPSGLKFNVMHKCQFKQFNKEECKSIENMQQMIKIAKQHPNQCVAGHPCDKNKKNSDNSMSFDGSIVRNIKKKSKNIMELYFFDVTISSSDQSKYQTKWKNAKKILDQIAKKAKNMKFYHIIIGQQQIFKQSINLLKKKIQKQQVNKNLIISFSSLQDLHWKVENFDLMVLLMQIKLIAKKNIEEKKLE